MIIETEEEHMERYLDNTERIMDVMAKWENKKKELKAKSQ